MGLRVSVGGSGGTSERLDVVFDMILGVGLLFGLEFGSEEWAAPSGSMRRGM